MYACGTFAYTYVKCIYLANTYDTRNFTMNY